MKLNRKTIVITGGSSGIGEQIVHRLAGSNKIIVIARNESKLRELRDQFSDLETFSCDLSDLRQVEKVVVEIQKKHEKIDVLINNAAVQFTPKFLDDDFRYETIKQEITVNFTSVCCLIYLLFPSLLHKDERAIILNVNSGLGLVPKTNSAIYCGTKGGLYIFSQSLKYQLESTNVRILQAIMPLVDTPMTEGRGKGKISPQEAASALIKGIENEIEENFIGKTKLLMFIYRLFPSLARKIMKRS